MKQPVIFCVPGLILFSCNKNVKVESGRCDTWLVISSTNSSKATTLAAGIKTVINCYGPNLCYSYSGLHLTPKTGNIYEFNAKGTAPCGPAICAQAIVEVKDSITLNPTQAGTYYLKFFNNTSLFKTDTIMVN